MRPALGRCEGWKGCDERGAVRRTRGGGVRPTGMGRERTRRDAGERAHRRAASDGAIRSPPARGVPAHRLAGGRLLRGRERPGACPSCRATTTDTRRARRATAIPVRSRTARCLAILGSLVFSRRLARSRTPDLRRAARSPFDRHLPRGGSSAAAASVRWPGRSQRAEILRVVWKSETTLNQTTESTGRRPDPSG